jgi:hypothetical protein
VGRRFNERSYERATLECDRVIETLGSDPDVRAKAKRLKQLIPQFERKFNEGLKRAAQQPESGYEALERAAELYAQIDLPGALGAEMNAALNESAMARSQNAWSRADYGSAAVACRGVLDRTPEDPEARKCLDRLASKAEDLYRLAYMVRDRDPKSAIQQLKTVLDVVPPGSPLYDKAKKQLKVLEP